MGEYKFIDFNKIKSQVSISQVLEAYGVSGLSKSGDKLRGKCPIHGGHNRRQFVVWPESSPGGAGGSWRCFGSCQRSGDMIQLVALLQGISNFEAAHEIAERFGLEQNHSQKQTRKQTQSKPAAKRSAMAKRALGEEREDEAQEQKERPPSNQPPEKLRPLTYLQSDHPFLLKRGILSDTAEYFGVGYAAKGTMAGRIAIPVHDEKGRLLAYAGAATKNHQKDWRFPKGFLPELEIFNAHRLPPHPLSQEEEERLTIALDPLIILQQFEQGQEHGVALIGKAVSNTQLDRLDEIIERQAYRHLDLITGCHFDIGQKLFTHFSQKGQIDTINLHWQRTD